MAETAKPFKNIALDRSRAKYWLGVGAQPSDPVWRLLSLVSIMIFFWATTIPQQQYGHDMTWLTRQVMQGWFGGTEVSSADLEGMYDHIL